MQQPYIFYTLIVLYIILKYTLSLFLSIYTTYWHISLFIRQASYSLFYISKSPGQNNTFMLLLLL